MREDLDIDAGLVHLLQAELAEIVEPAADLRRPTFRPVEGLRNFGVVVVLFKSDDEGLSLGSHVSSSVSVLR